MYDRSSWYDPLVEQIKAQDADGILKKKYILLLQVELGLWLLERLGLRDEAIAVLWVLLSGLPLPDARLSTLDQQQRHIVANARILLPFSGRFNWENALRTYASIEEKWRSYRVNPDMLENQVVYNLQTHQERFLVYDTVLDGILPFAPRTITPTAATTYCFDAITSQGKQVIQIEMSEEVVEMALINIPWFTRPRNRVPLSYAHSDFRAIASEIDQLCQQRGLQTALGLQKSWVELVDDLLGYHAILPDGSIADKNSVSLHIDGHAYVVGAVAAGKSTVAKLILADAALHLEKDLRITLVVSDTMSALNLADEFNTLFCTWGENPVAVPLIGRSHVICICNASTIPVNFVLTTGHYAG